MHREGQPVSDFTIVYHLLSFARNEYLRVKVPLKPIDTATDLWPAANWYEREVWEMFGIRFQGHPNPERILMPRTWAGHPPSVERVVIPPREALGAIEGAEGNSGYYLVSDGGAPSYRTRIRTSSFAQMQMAPWLSRGRSNKC